MIDRLLRCGSVLFLAALLGCAAPGTEGKEVPEYCPACKVKVVKHASLRGRVPAHTHIKYLCPSCGKEWEGESVGGGGTVCPKCGRTLKQCPACCGKGATQPHHDE